MAKIFSTKKPEEILDLLRSGNIEELEAYTDRIQFHPKQVLQFEEIYDAFFGDDGDIDWEDPEGSCSIQEVMQEIEDEFNSFLSKMPAARDPQTFMTFFNHGAGEITIEVGWDDNRAGRVLWDRWQGKVANPVRAFAQVAFVYDSIDYQCVPKPKPAPLPAMYQYHPERYKASRGFAAKMVEMYRQQSNSKTGMVTMDTFRQIGDLVGAEMNRKTMDYPRRLREDTPHATFVFGAETSIGTAYGRYGKAGRQILHFPPELTEMLRNTDVESIPMNAIHLPFQSQYIYLGPQAGLELAPGWLVDGAYVESRGEPGDLRFTITAVPADPTQGETWFIYPEPHYSQDYIETYRDKDLAQAIEGVLAEELQGLSKKLLEAGGDITDKVREQAKKEGKDIPPNMRLEDVSVKNAHVRLEDTKRQHPIYRAAMRLIVNALCYITAYPDDISRVWPEGTPRGLREKAESADAKTATKAFSKLAAMGYSPVHICGKRIQEQMAQAGVSSGPQHGVTTHWRRGHWRNQVHGAGRSLRKLIWIMPMLIGGGHDADAPGHIYLVEQREKAEQPQ